MSDIALDGLSYDRGQFSGNGYIAGTLPIGLVTINGAPGGRAVEVRNRITRGVVAVIFSKADGTYLIDNIDPYQLYDVIGRDWSATYNDVIISRVSPRVD